MKILKYIFSAKYRKRKKFEKEIKKLNPETEIIPKNIVPMELIKFGKYSYGRPIIRTFGLKNEKIIIENYVSIAEDVTFILSGEHYIDTFSTFPISDIILKNNTIDALSKGKIVVKDDVWIGTGATILSGVTIGQGAIVGAGAVVVNDLEPYGIYGGVPAKLIRYRFEKAIVEELKKIDFSNIDFKLLKNRSELLYKRLCHNKWLIFDEK